MRSTEPVAVEFEYQLDKEIKGLRLGIYLMTNRGEFVFTSFDTDSPGNYEEYAVRPTGHFVSRCQIPADILNEGQYILGVNASVFRVKRYFHDEHALAFHVDGSGAPGKQWAETRLGPVRPDLDWQIEEAAAE
jgi:lipopolysaccharide transport system ATP-binding protein